MIVTVLIAVVAVSAFPVGGRLDRPRRRVAPGADRRDRDGVRRAPAGGARRRAARRRRALRRADPVRGGDDRDHGVHAPRTLDGGARDAAARVRPARAALARLARGDFSPSGLVAIAIVVATGIFGGDDAAFLASAVLVRRPVRVHGGTARRDPAAPEGARPRTPVQGEARGADPRRAAPAAGADRRPADLRGLGARADHPPGRALRRARLARSSGSVVFVVVRRRREAGVLDDVDPVATLPPGAAYRKVLVPMKLGDIGEEMVATAVALAKERGAERRGRLRRPRAARVPARGRASRGRARSAPRRRSPRRARSGRRTASRSSRTRSSPARSATRSSTRRAERGADLIVLGSSPRWRRQSRFFSPTVDHVLRHAPCEVLVVAFPEGTFEE